MASAPSASWYGNAASSAVYGAYVTVAGPVVPTAQGGTASFAVTATFAPPSGFSWAVVAGRGLRSVTFQLNLSRF